MKYTIGYTFKRDNLFLIITNMGRLLVAKIWLGISDSLDNNGIKYTTIIVPKWKIFDIGAIN